MARSNWMCLQRDIMSTPHCHPTDSNMEDTKTKSTASHYKNTHKNTPQMPCSSGGADERRAGELSLACAAGDASVAEFVWLPGPGVAEALGMADAKRLTPSGRGAEVAAELSRWEEDG